MSSVETNFAPDRRLPATTGPRPDAANKTFDWILTVAFLLAVIVPLIGAWAHWDPVNSLNEQRAPAPLPPMPHTLKEAETFPAAFSAFFRDHFGFRNTLIYYVQDARFKLGLLTHNDQVLVGKDGWLFLCQRNGPGFNRERGFDYLFTQAELAEWQAFLERRQAFLQARGIKFVMTIAPEKQAIYPEFMPDGLAVPGPSRIDQLVQELKRTHSPVVFVDMRPAIIAKKPTRELYMRRDTHWNDWGAWAGYEELMKAIRPLFPNQDLGTQSITDFKEISGGIHRGGCVSLLGMAQWDEEWPVLTRPAGFVTKVDANASWEGPDPHRPRLLFLRDSFGLSLLPKLWPHFSYMYASRRDSMDSAMVAREKPDIVLAEMVERKLFLPIPPDSFDIQTTPIRPR